MSRRTASLVGWGSVCLVTVLSVPLLAISATNPPPVIPVSSDLESTTSFSLVVFVVVIYMAFSIVGAVIVSNRPDNGLGWLFAVGGSVVAVEFLALVYGYRALVADPGSLPAGHVAAWMQDILDLPGIGFLSVFLFLLFPEGRLETRAQWRVAIVAVLGIGLGVLGAILEPTIQGYRDVATPLNLGTSATLSAILQGIGYVVFTVALVASVVLLIRRLRRAVGRERDQLRLLAWAAVVGMALFTPAIFLPSTVIEGYQTLVYAIGGVGLLLIPISVGVAILRHKLLDIDLVIRRTVVIALLGAFITAVYVGVVVGVGALVGSSGNAVLSAIAAALVALAFQPARRWAQRLANRFVYGKRATPYEVLHEFSERVASSYGMEDVLPRMAAILGEGTGAERAQVWLRIGPELRPVGACPNQARRSGPVVAPGDALPPIPDVSHAAPVRDRGELLGALSITKEPSDPVTTTEEKLVGDLALQAGLVLRNARLLEDLRASRGRLVAAHDEERRKLERNIHDGAQQQLVALAVKAKLLDTMIDRDVLKAHEMLAQIQEETHGSLEALRELARGIYPPLLADKGLAAALEAQARKAPMPVALSDGGVGRYPKEVEATVYFCCLEAMQNASKYAEAANVRISLSHDGTLLSFRIDDDGRGFDPQATRHGIGLQNMTDRLEAVGGSLEVRSAPGAGTSVIGRIEAARAAVTAP